MDATGGDATTRRPAWPVRHPLLTALGALFVAFVVWAVVLTQQTNATRDAAAAACREEIQSRYVDPDKQPIVLVDYVGTPHAMEFQAVDTLAMFKWTCMATKTSDGFELDIWK